MNPEGIARGNNAAVLSLGDDGAGLPFHAHGAAWLAVVHGGKRWFIYEPGTMPSSVRGNLNPLMATRQWVNSQWAAVSRLPANWKPIVCDQMPGEMLYLPERWMHATMNLGETIAVGGQAPG